MDNIDICKIENLPKNIINQSKKNRIERSGVIIYTICDNKFYFGLGVDHESGDITDFGGGIKKKDFSLIDGTLREFTEESLGVFGKFSHDEIEKCICVYNQHTMIVFIPLKLDKNKINKTFNQRLKYVKEPEVDSIFWITKETFINLVYGKKVYDEYEKCERSMYTRIRSVFSSALNKNNFISCL
uniref:NUDIX hydrolase n=1 Tax=Pithovirus LCPAC101 TaxID=2506586 RepID=A0A481Z2D7_9VIRU|nr:MAG: NUDIX hydrolase [Pithovirus LCPAC101]